MPMWNEYEIRKVTERRDGAIFKTQVIGTEWFEVGKGPECYIECGGIMYCATTNYVIQKDKPSA